MTANKKHIPEEKAKTLERSEHLRDISRGLGARWRQTGTCALRFAAASLPFLSEEDFDALRHDSNRSVRERLIAASFQLSRNMQEEIVKGRSVRLRRALARNMQISPEIVIRLSNDNDREVRKYGLENPLCPEEYLERAARDGEADLAFAVARNPQLSDQLILELLERDDIRAELIDYQFMRLSANKKFFFSRCSFETFQQLWTEPPYPFDSDPALEAEFRRLIITGRGSVFAGEQKEYAAAGAHKKKEQKGKTENSEPFCMKLSWRDLMQLAGSSDKEVRVILAKTPDLPSGIASKLIRDADAEVRHTVYLYQPLPEDVLEAAAMETDEPVLMSICRSIRNAIRQNR